MLQDTLVAVSTNTTAQEIAVIAQALMVIISALIAIFQKRR